MGQRGGYRENGGRKLGSKNKSTILSGQARQVMVDKILEHWEPLINAKLDLALGDFYFIGAGQDPDDPVPHKIYKARPHPESINFLLEMVAGKADQPISGKLDVPQLTDLANAIRSVLSLPKRT